MNIKYYLIFIILNINFNNGNEIFLKISPLKRSSVKQKLCSKALNNILNEYHSKEDVYIKNLNYFKRNEFKLILESISSIIFDLPNLLKDGYNENNFNNILHFIKEIDFNKLHWLQIETIHELWLLYKTNHLKHINQTTIQDIKNIKLVIQYMEENCTFKFFESIQRQIFLMKYNYLFEISKHVIKDNYNITQQVLNELKYLDVEFSGYVLRNIIRYLVVYLDPYQFIERYLSDNHDGTIAAGELNQILEK